MKHLPTVTIAASTVVVLGSVYGWASDTVSKACFSGLGSGDTWAYALVMNQVTHAGLLHLVLNMAAFANLGVLLEHKLGHLGFAALLLLSSLGTNAMSSLYYLLVSKRCGVGVSGVVFALMGFWCHGMREARVDVCFLVVPAAAAPWVMLLIVQMLFSNAAFGVHVAGLLSGILVYYCIPTSVWSFLGPDAEEDGTSLLNSGGLSHPPQVARSADTVEVAVAEGGKKFMGKGHRLGN